MRKRPARTAYFMRSGSYITVPQGRMRWPMRTVCGQPSAIKVRRTKPSYVKDDGRTKERYPYGF